MTQRREKRKRILILLAFVFAGATAGFLFYLDRPVTPLDLTASAQPLPLVAAGEIVIPELDRMRSEKTEIALFALG